MNFFFLCSLCREKTEFFLTSSLCLCRRKHRREQNFTKTKKHKKKAKFYLRAQERILSKNQEKEKKTKDTKTHKNLSLCRFCALLNTTTPTRLLLILIEERPEREYILQSI